MQGSQGLRKHGIPSNSGAVQGYRYNARVLARHLAESRFGARVERRIVRAEEVAPMLLAEASRGPELWHQRSYLARVFTVGTDGGMEDAGIQPLAYFVDDSRPEVAEVLMNGATSRE